MQARVRAFVARWYVTFVLALSVFAPELRRLSDWQLGFSKYPVINVLPMLSLFGVLVVLKRSWRKSGPLFRSVAMLWMLGFGYAFLVAFLSGQTFGAIYDLLGFITPMAFGLLVAEQSSGDFRAMYDRVGTSLLVLGVIASVYAIYQYVAPPPWDVYWVANSGLSTIGSAVPFGLRVFGPLNAPGPFGDFLTFALVLNLPRLRLAKPTSLAAIAVMLIALELTLVRTDWIAFGVALVVYAFFSPRRGAALGSLVAIGLLSAAIGGILVASVPNAGDTVTTISNRFSSFGELGDDSSAVARKQETDNAIDETEHEPLGLGLGAIGTAGKLGNADETVTLDNGYLSRFVEMGFLGASIYLIAIAVAVGGSARAFLAQRRAGSSASVAILAAALATQVMLLWLDVSSDHHGGLSGYFFWFSLALSSGSLATNTAVETAARSARIKFANALAR